MTILYWWTKDWPWLLSFPRSGGWLLCLSLSRQPSLRHLWLATGHVGHGCGSSGESGAREFSLFSVPVEELVRSPLLLDFERSLETIEFYHIHSYSIPPIGSSQHRLTSPGPLAPLAILTDAGMGWGTRTLRTRHTPHQGEMVRWSPNIFDGYCMLL